MVDDPDATLNAAVDDPTDQRTTDPEKPTMREAPGRGATTKSAGQGNVKADAPLDDPDREGKHPDSHPVGHALRSGAT